MENVKTKVGPCWRSFIQGELSRGSHNTQPRKERKIKEHSTGMTETRAARVEQNTRHKAEPSTLYQVYRRINSNNSYCDIPTYPCSNMEQTSTSPATNHAIRGVEQSVNLAKQRFARNEGEKLDTAIWEA